MSQGASQGAPWNGVDPFRDVRGEGEDGSLMGQAGAAVLCAVCCVCCMVSLLLAYIIWALYTITNSVSSTTTECGQLSNVWIFCLMVVIVMPLLGCAVSLIASFANKTGLQSIPGVMNLAMGIWGMILWGSMTQACADFYGTMYPDLFLLFKINVILLAITFFTLVCVVLVGAAFLGGALATDGYRGNSGYQNVPDEGDKDDRLRTAARYGQLDEVDKLLRGGASVHSLDPNDGMTALHHAALGGHMEVARRLVNAGANIDAETKAGDTPLRLAHGKHEVENFLKSCGARDSMGSPGGDAATQEYV